MIRLKLIALVLAVGLLAAAPAPAPAPPPAPAPAPAPARAAKVDVITIEGAINPATVNFIKTSIEAAEQSGAQALVIELNTPGGLVSSTKEIVQLFYGAKLPVVVYVSPAGATAGSAGLMITIAAHVAAMAPGTNIGAAHPVIFDQEGYKSMPKDDVMMEKITNDAVSWVKSICDVRKRNPELAEKAVAESKSYTAEEAVKGKLVDLAAKDLADLFDVALEGRLVELNSGSTVKLATKGAEVVRLEMSLPQTLQNAINDPTLIYILFLAGMLGVALEFKAPGMIFPAVIGVGLILFALLGPSLPINYAGLLLLLIGFAFLIGELFVTTHGVLALFGLAALIFGSLMLFNAPEVPNMDPFLVPNLGPPLWLIASLAIFIAAVILVFGGAIIKTHRQKVMTGVEEMVGLEGIAESEIGPAGGKIFAHGEYWNAESDQPIAKGDKVVIKSVQNLLCKVGRIGPAKKDD